MEIAPPNNYNYFSTVDGPILNTTCIGAKILIYKLA